MRGRGWWCIAVGLALPGSVGAKAADDLPRIVHADIVALDQLLVYNRFGSFNPYGMIFALRRDVSALDGATGKAEPGKTEPSCDARDGTEPGEVRLKDCKRLRPLVLRGTVGDDRGDEVRGFVADRSRQAEALSERMPPGTRRIVEEGLAPGPAGPAEPREPWEKLADGAVLDGPALVLASPDAWSRLCRHVRRGARLFAPLHDVEAALPCLRAAGATVTVADPSSHASGVPQDPFAVRLVRTAAAILDDALVQAGRDLTRGGLMRAFDTVRRDDLPWPALDFKRYPLSGSRSIQIKLVVGSY